MALALGGLSGRSLPAFDDPISPLRIQRDLERCSSSSGRMIRSCSIRMSLKFKPYFCAALSDKRMPAADKAEGLDPAQDAVGILFGRDVAEGERVGRKQIRRHEVRARRRGSRCRRGAFAARKNRRIPSSCRRPFARADGRGAIRRTARRRRRLWRLARTIPRRAGHKPGAASKGRK